MSLLWLPADSSGSPAAVDLCDNTIQLLTQTKNGYREFAVIENVAAANTFQTVQFFHISTHQPNVPARTTNIPKHQIQQPKSYASVQMVLKKQINVWKKKERWKKELHSFK